MSVSGGHGKRGRTDRGVRGRRSRGGQRALKEDTRTKAGKQIGKPHFRVVGEQLTEITKFPISDDHTNYSSGGIQTRTPFGAALSARLHCLNLLSARAFQSITTSIYDVDDDGGGGDNDGGGDDDDDGGDDDDGDDDDDDDDDDDGGGDDVDDSMPPSLSI